VALRATTDHPKFWDLGARLGMPRYRVLGILEGLWHFTGRFCPQGNIGKYPDDQIASWLGWENHVPALMEALIGSGWLDECVRYRLIVHDWAEHADHTTKISLKRKGLNLVECGECEHCSHTVRTLFAPPVPVPVPEPVPDIYSIEKPPKKGKGEELYLREYDFLMNGAKVGDAYYTGEEGEWQEAQPASYPKREGDRGVTKGRVEYLKLRKGGAEYSEVRIHMVRYRAWAEWKGIIGTEFIMKVQNFLKGEDWESLAQWEIGKSKEGGNGNGGY